MATYYHVDGSGQLREGDVLRALDVPRDPSAPVRGRLVDELFPDVMSQGRLWLSTAFAEAARSSGQTVLGRMHEIAVEFILELVRRERYADRPSRFETLYAFRSESEALTSLRRSHLLRATAGLRCDAAIVEVEGARFFEADHERAWSDSGRTAAKALDSAEAYWRGVIRDGATVEVLVSPPIRVVRRVEIPAELLAPPDRAMRREVERWRDRELRAMRRRVGAQ